MCAYATLAEIPDRAAKSDDALLIVTSAEYLWWRNLQGGPPVTVQLRGEFYTAHAQAFREAALAAEAVQPIYPKLDAERAAQFAAGKVTMRATYPQQRSRPAAQALLERSLIWVYTDE
ncbi:MAG: hypothetical protein SNJ58_02445 [Aggregatilineales bacterium]